MKTLKLTFVLSLLLMTSCSKEDTETTPTFTETKGIYICGSGWETIRSIPKLWHDNNSYNFEHYGNGGRAESMAFLGDDLYTVGLTNEANGNQKHVIWKNLKIETVLSNEFSSFPYLIEINKSNNDIIIAGYESIAGEQNKAKIWRNGIKTTLSNVSGAMALDIETKNDDEFIVGCLPLLNVESAVYWKNGVLNFLTDGIRESVARSITIVNNDVYIAGYEKNFDGIKVAKFWKNGVAINLTDGTSDAQAIQVSVKNNNVYVLGSEVNLDGVFVRKYWINGIENALNNNVNVSSFVLSNNIFYEIGYYNNTTCFWKERNIELLGNSQEYFSSIILKE